MLRMSNRNRKKSSKTNSSHVGKSVEKKSEYVEEVNEVILNDLVPEERRNEFGMEEVQQKTPKKKGGLKFNLGLNSKKKPSSNSSTENKGKSKGVKSEASKNKSNDSHVDKHKASESSSNSGHSSKGKHTEQESTSSTKGKSKGKSSKKESTSSKKEKTSNKKGKNSSSTESNKKSPKKKGSSKSQSVSKEDYVDVNKDVTEKTNHKASTKKSTGIKKKRVHEHDDDLNNNQIPIREIEDYVPIDFDIEEEETGKSFRSEEHVYEEPTILEEQDPANKFEDLIWSEDKFPKK